MRSAAGSRYIPLVVLSGVVMLISSTPGAGLMLVLFIPLFAFQLIPFVQSRTQEGTGLNIAIVAAFFCAASSIQFICSYESTSAANAVASAAEDFYQKNGRYARSFGELAAPNLPPEGAWHIVYNPRGEIPRITYSSTFFPFRLYVYDFVRRKWIARDS